MICVEFCRNFCLHVENLHPSLSPCRIYPRWWSKFQLQVLNSTVSTLQLVFNSPVVWWCSANLFSCKLEGGWWAPAIQQNLGFVYKENHYYYTWEFDISLKICKQYRFWTVQSKCVNLQPQLKSELNKSRWLYTSGLQWVLKFCLCTVIHKSIICIWLPTCVSCWCPMWSVYSCCKWNKFVVASSVVPKSQFWSQSTFV